MARVTIIFDDKEDADGTKGLRISCESDPKFPENDEDQTPAQNAAIGILEMILDGCEDVRSVDMNPETNHELN